LLIASAWDTQHDAVRRGTGAYKGISGHGFYTLNIKVITKRNANGACHAPSNTGNNTAGEIDMITAAARQACGSHGRANCPCGRHPPLP
jgi:hypothetical protein